MPHRFLSFYCELSQTYSALNLRRVAEIEMSLRVGLVKVDFSFFFNLHLQLHEKWEKMLKNSHIDMCIRYSVKFTSFLPNFGI